MKQQQLSTDEVFAYLRQKLTELIASGEAWQMEIHGKGASVQVKLAKFEQFPGQPKRLEERR